MEGKYVIATAVCVSVVVIIIVVVVVVVLIRRRRRIVRRRAPQARPQSSVSVEGAQQVRAAKNYRISRDDIVERSGKDDLDLNGVTVSPTGQAVTGYVFVVTREECKERHNQACEKGWRRHSTAMCPPTPPVGAVPPPHLPPI